MFLIILWASGAVYEVCWASSSVQTHVYLFLRNADVFAKQVNPKLNGNPFKSKFATFRLKLQTNETKENFFALPWQTVGPNWDEAYYDILTKNDID